MYEVFQSIFRVSELRNKILFIFGILVVYRVIANIPLPGVDVLALKRLFDDNAFLGLLNMFSGGGLSNISIVLLGVAPYITASIIMQLMTTLVPTLERLYKEEGEQGRQKFNMYTRWLTVPLAALQSFSMLSLLRSQQILGDIASFEMAVIIITATGAIMGSPFRFSQYGQSGIPVSELFARTAEHVDSMAIIRSSRPRSSSIAGSTG